MSETQASKIHHISSDVIRLIHAEGFQKTFDIESGLRITIERIFLNDDSYANYKLLSIQNDAFDRFGDAIHKDPLLLPQLYVALLYLTGPSDTLYDSWKGSYSFCFQLSVEKNGVMSEYFYHIYHYRSYIEFAIQQVVSKSDQRDPSSYHQPNDELFSNDDIYYFSVYFCSYALGYLSTSHYKPDPFVKGSYTNAFLFGYKEGEYFIENADGCDKYYERKASLKEDIAHEYQRAGVNT